MDGVAPEIIKCGKEESDKILAKVFNFCYENGTIHSKAWRKAKIVSLHKAGDKRIPGNYRGISLHSVMGKMYASILNSRLSKYLEGKKLLATGQNGFRTGVECRSCEDHLFTLTENCKLMVRQGRRPYLFFLDFSKAFDTVNHKLLMYKLRTQMKVKGKLLKAIESLYKNLTAVASINGKNSKEFQLDIGTAQGCPLSPTLFAVYINDLVLELQRHPAALADCPALAYADDIEVAADNAHNIQQLVTLCYNWTKKWRMAANVKKCAIMKLEYGRLHNSAAEVITWNGVPLPIVDEYKYLGLIIDKKLNFKKHATKKLSACASRLGMISAFCRNPKIPYKMKKQLISATSLSGIAYGIQFYGWEQQKILKDAISKAARQLTGTDKRTNGEAITLISGLRPLRTTAEIRGKKQINKIANLDDDRLSKCTLLRARGNYSLSHRTRNTPSTDKEIDEMCKKARDKEIRRLQSSRCPHLEMGPWNSAKESESCSIRDKARISEDAFCIHRSKLEEGFWAVCPLCPDDRSPRERPEVPQYHCYTDCRVTENNLDELLTTIERDDGPFQRPANKSELLTKLLNPEHWSKNANIKINKWVTNTNNMIKKAHLTNHMPRLAELININDEFPLNENMEGEVFVVDNDSTTGIWAGKRRFRATNYCHHTNTFDGVTTGLDICEDSQNWMTMPDMDLNDYQKAGRLKYIPPEEVVWLNKDIERVRQGLLFDSNIIGKTLKIQQQPWSFPNSNAYSTVTVVNYDELSDKHTVLDCSGSSAKLLRLSLNEMRARGRIDPLSIAFFSEVLSRLRLVRINPSPSSAARSMPRGMTD